MAKMDGISLDTLVSPAQNLAEKLMQSDSSKQNTQDQSKNSQEDLSIMTMIDNEPEDEKEDNNENSGPQLIGSSLAKKIKF